jgi:hypothetical protein
MVKIISTLLGAASLLTVNAAVSDWVGTWNDPIYGGNFDICVSTVNGVSYGQAVFSKLGYMRGAIDVNDVWVGIYYLAGFEARTGTFSLSLTTGTPSTFTGVFNLAPGNTMSYDVSSAQTSAGTPSDVECMKTDNSLLGQTSGYSAFGTWHDGDNVDLSLIDYTDTYVTSYYYPKDTTLTSYYYGTSIGSRATNQVYLANWHEASADEGLEILVAKNAVR